MNKSAAGGSTQSVKATPTLTFIHKINTPILYVFPGHTQSHQEQRMLKGTTQLQRCQHHDRLCLVITQNGERL